MTITPDTRPTVHFHPLTFLADGDDVVVGRTDIDSYAVLPADGAALLRELVAGRSPAAAADWYAERYAEPVDIDDFLATLGELDFLRTAPAVAPRPVRLQRLGRAVFSPAGWICFGLLVAGAVGALVADPALLPAKHQVFFSPYLLVIEFVLFAGQLPLTLLHESFHLLAGRRLGLHSRIGIGHRMYYLVAETAIDGLVVVPRRQRWLPMLAGMLADLLGMAVLVLVAFATRHPDGGVALGGQVCLALAYTSVLRFVWQFYFFLRTDIYYLVTTLIGCNDLHTVSSELLRNTVDRMLGRNPRFDAAGWHPRDRRVARWYAPLHAAGYLVMIGVLVFAVLPLAWRFLTTALRTAFDGSASALETLDAVGMLALSFGPMLASAALYLHRRHRHNQESS